MSRIFFDLSNIDTSTTHIPENGSPSIKKTGLKEIEYLFDTFSNLLQQLIDSFLMNLTTMETTTSQKRKYQNISNAQLMPQTTITNTNATLSKKIDAFIKKVTEKESQISSLIQKLQTNVNENNNIKKIKITSTIFNSETYKIQDNEIPKNILTALESSKGILLSIIAFFETATELNFTPLIPMNDDENWELECLKQSNYETIKYEDIEIYLEKAIEKIKKESVSSINLNIISNNDNTNNPTTNVSNTIVSETSVSHKTARFYQPPKIITIEDLNSNPICEEITVTGSTGFEVFEELKNYPTIKTVWLGKDFSDPMKLINVETVEQIGLSTHSISYFDKNLIFPNRIRSIAIGKFDSSDYSKISKAISLNPQISEITLTGGQAKKFEKIFDHAAEQLSKKSSNSAHQIVQINLGSELTESEVTTFFDTKPNTPRNNLYKQIGISRKTPPNVITSIPYGKTIYLEKDITSQHIKQLSQIQIKEIIISGEVPLDIIRSLKNNFEIVTLLDNQEEQFDILIGQLSTNQNNADIKIIYIPDALCDKKINDPFNIGWKEDLRVKNIIVLTHSQKEQLEQENQYDSMRKVIITMDDLIEDSPINNINGEIHITTQTEDSVLQNVNDYKHITTVFLSFDVDPINLTEGSYVRTIGFNITPENILMPPTKFPNQINSLHLDCSWINKEILKTKIDPIYENIFSVKSSNPSISQFTLSGSGIIADSVISAFENLNLNSPIQINLGHHILPLEANKLLEQFKQLCTIGISKNTPLDVIKNFTNIVSNVWLHIGAGTSKEHLDSLPRKKFYKVIFNKDTSTDIIKSLPINITTACLIKGTNKEHLYAIVETFKKREGPNKIYVPEDLFDGNDYKRFNIEIDIYPPAKTNTNLSTTLNSNIRKTHTLVPITSTPIPMSQLLDQFINTSPIISRGSIFPPINIETFPEFVKR